ncbi:MAG TPA: Gfo/Idh/MocA family oxidoreductase [Ktedonobacterales bacterium]|nr:Gfo/Idh/MocA family oxidoreductase [Ktedonobacterales bacterium]
MEGSLAWGVLGTGTVARLAMLPALSRIPSAHVLAVGSASRERAELCAAQHHIPRAYGTYQDVLDDPDIHAVYVALPNALHREWVIRAARAGKHVLCEKPLGCAAGEVEEMARACDSASVLLMEALMYHFHPRTERLRDLLAGGIIGEVRHVSAAFTFSLEDWSNYRAHPDAGGGALLDVGGYCVSAVRSILGAEPVAISAVAHVGDTGIDDTTAALLEFTAGRTADIVCSFRAAEHQRITIIGTAGVLEVPLAFTAWQSDAAPLHIHRAGTAQTLSGDPADPYALMAECFTEAVRNGTPAPYPLAETLATARVIDAIARAATTHHTRPTS